MPIPKITVIIPTYDAARTLADCLRSVFASQYPNYEVIVVDDGSRDDSAAIAQQFPCHLVRLPKNVGASQAKNAGAAQATGDVVFFR
jgi:glycosyltransferase involved in cell wall biosynthesis